MKPLDYDLIAKVLSQEATPAETAQLQELCAADPAVQKAFDEAKAVWALAEDIVPRFAVDKSAAWAKIQARTGMGTSPVEFPEIKPQKKRFSLPLWSRWAAAAVVVAVGATLLLQQLPASGNHTIVASQNRQEVTLPDGSTVFLKKNARLQYATAFGKQKERHLLLEGEAFFDVVKDPKHPFTIDAQNLRVTVLGTSFRVNSSAQEVAVRSGKVQVTEAVSQATVLLEAGEGVQLSGNALLREVADSNDYFLKTGKIAFTNKPFEAIIGDISRILGVPVQLDASIPPAGRAQAVTYSTTASSPESVLSDLCRITGYQWRGEGGSYRIFQAR